MAAKMGQKMSIHSGSGNNDEVKHQEQEIPSHDDELLLLHILLLFIHSILSPWRSGKDPLPPTALLLCLRLSHGSPTSPYCSGKAFYDVEPRAQKCTKIYKNNRTK